MIRGGNLYITFYIYLAYYKAAYGQWHKYSDRLTSIHIFRPNHFTRIEEYGVWRRIVISSCLWPFQCVFWPLKIIVKSKMPYVQSIVVWVISNCMLPTITHGQYVCIIYYIVTSIQLQRIIFQSKIHSIEQCTQERYELCSFQVE